MIFDRLLGVAPGVLPQPGSSGGYFDWLLNWVSDSEKTASGVTVSAESASTISAVHCATTVISNGVRIPLFAYRDLGNDRKERAKKHPVYRLLHRRPNRETTPSQFKAYMQTSALLWDTGYALIDRKMGGEPTALWPIHPNRVIPQRSDAGELFFLVRNTTSGQHVRVNDADMLRIYDTSRDGVGGTSLVRLARESLGLSLATERHGATFFGNGARPGGYIRTAGQLNDKAKANLARSWGGRHEGVSQANRLGVLEQGHEYVPLGLPNEVSQFLETRQFQIEEIARWFNIQPHLLKHLLRATYDNIESESLAFLTITMDPWYIVWEEECTAKLFSQQEQEDGYYVKFQVNAILRADSKARAEFYSKMVFNGTMTRNQVRLLEEWDSYGPEGDIPLIPANMTTMAQLLAADLQTARSASRRRESDSADGVDIFETPVAGAGGEAVDGAASAGVEAARRREAFSRLLRDVYGRIVTKQVDRIRRAAHKQLSEDAFTAWLASFCEESEESVRATLAPVWGSCGALAGEDVGPDAAVGRYLGSARGQLMGVLRDREPMVSWDTAVEQRLQEWTEGRADVLAEQELGYLLSETSNANTT